LQKQPSCTVFWSHKLKLWLQKLKSYLEVWEISRATAAPLDLTSAPAATNPVYSPKMLCKTVAFANMHNTRDSCNAAGCKIVASGPSSLFIRGAKNPEKKMKYDTHTPDVCSRVHVMKLGG